MYHSRFSHSAEKVFAYWYSFLILGERELRDFENLLLRSRIIDAVQSDFQDLTNMREEYESALKQRINSKKKLLIFMMLFEKIDATNMSIYDYSRLIEAGIVDSKSCLINGTGKMHPTSKIIDNAWKSKYKIISALYKITDTIFSENGIDIYSKNLVHEESLFDLCDSYLYGGKSDFFLSTAY